MNNLQLLPMPASAKPDLPAMAEIYTAPPPPEKGRVIGLDCHPDTYTAAVFQGQTPHNARKLTTRENLTLEKLLNWATTEFNREDLFLMEAGTNSFEIHRRLLAKGLRAVVLESAHVGKHAKSYADNDKMAAARIALVYLSGNAPCVWVPDMLSCERRELLHAYLNAVGHQTALPMHTCFRNVSLFFSLSFS
jgi:transposase